MGGWSILQGRRWRGWLLGAYLVLLFASQVYQRWQTQPPPPTDPDRHTVALPAMTTHGQLNGRNVKVSYLDFVPAHAKPGSKPVILLHGTPGNGEDFKRLAGRLNQLGYRVLAPDLPGNGQSETWPDSYAMRAHAYTLLAMMDQLHIGHAHVVGWSNGGAVVLDMADIAPDRLASITMLAAVGDQACEGSGDFYFEHFKYALGFGLLVVGPELVPHFGLFPSLAFRVSAIRSFYDTDQRPLRGIMQHLNRPTLILHGRDDVLVSYTAALRHHDLIHDSELVMIDANHFIPFMQADEAAAIMGDFFSRHDDPDSPAIRRTTILAAPRPLLFGPYDGTVTDALIASPWWADLAGVFVVAMIFPPVALALVGFLAPINLIDFLVAILGLWFALMLRRARKGKWTHWAWLTTLGISVGGFILVNAVTRYAVYHGQNLAGLPGEWGGLLTVFLGLWIIAWTCKRLRRPAGSPRPTGGAYNRTDAS